MRVREIVHDRAAWWLLGDRDMRMRLGTKSILLAVALGCGSHAVATGPGADGGNPDAGNGGAVATGPGADTGNPGAGDGGIATGPWADGGDGGGVVATGTEAGANDGGGPEAGGGNPEADANDSGGPDTVSDGAAPSCPATYADVPQFSPCSGYVSCDYYGQFNCQCMYWGDTLEWVCTDFNCVCLPSDAAAGTFPPGNATSSCMNQYCNTDTDCPSGQHCSEAVGPFVSGGGTGTGVCSVGCEGDFSSGGAMASCPFGGTCEHIAP
jgi:hypothetical protein